MPYFIVEYDHDPPLTDDALVAMSTSLEPCLEVRGIRKLRSWISHDRRRGICEYHAADAGSLRDAYHSATVRFARVWSGTLFEPNDFRLWKRVTRTISSFLTLVWRQGALMGETPEKSFYVKCDDETNPPEVTDVGQMIVEIGLAPVKPAEFVIFRIGQMPAGGGVQE